MELRNLPKSTTKSKKRLGRGYGSGKGGHTVGRGQKGQKSRSKVSVVFEGTKFRKSLIRRLPLLRGKGKLKPGKKPVIVNIKYLNLLPKGSVVDINALVKNQIVDEKEAKEFGVKILGEGKLGVSLKVALSCSKGAAEAIKKAGGEIIKLKMKNEKSPARNVARPHRIRESVSSVAQGVAGGKMKGEQKKKTKKEKSVKIRPPAGGSVKSKRPVEPVKIRKAKTKDE